MLHYNFSYILIQAEIQLPVIPLPCKSRYKAKNSFHKLNLKDEIKRSQRTILEMGKQLDNGRSVFGMNRKEKSWREMLTSMGIFRHPRSEKMLHKRN